MISIVALDGLEPRDLWAIRTRLTKAGSEFQSEVSAAMDGEASSCTPIAVCHLDGAMVGWACSHLWRGQQTLEQFVDERHRRKGIAMALSAAMVAHGSLDRSKHVAVFSPVTAAIARKLWAADVLLYERNGTDWVLT